MPLIDSLREKSGTARFSRALATLLKAGVPLPEALGCVQPILGLPQFRRAVARIGDALSDGNTFAAAIQDQGIFDPLMVHLVRIGEETGTLDAQLLRLAEWFERDLTQATTRAAALIEPLLIVGIGALVGTIVLFRICAFIFSYRWDTMNTEQMSRDERIHAHRGMCRSTAMRFVRPGLELADLEQVAIVGLIKATDIYNPTFGTSFHAFARRRIIGELMHYVRDYESLIRLPRNLHELHYRERKISARLQSELGRIPVFSELAEALDCSKEQLEALRDARNRCNLADLDEHIQRDATVHDLAERVVILTSLHHLDRDESALLMGIYGLRLSQTEVGMRLGYTQRSASRLHKRALQKLSLFLGET